MTVPCPWYEHVQTRRRSDMRLSQRWRRNFHLTLARQCPIRLTGDHSRIILQSSTFQLRKFATERWLTIPTVLPPFLHACDGISVFDLIPIRDVQDQEAKVLPMLADKLSRALQRRSDVQAVSVHKVHILATINCSLTFETCPATERQRSSPHP